MSITDELRLWAARELASWKMARERYDEIAAIADRIDAEHETKVAYWQEASYRDGYDEGFASADDWLAQHEDAMAEHGWVKLPVSEDGDVLHVGELVDEKLPFGGYAAPAPIDTMELSRGAGGYRWMVKLDAENRALISPRLLRHHHEPTVEATLGRETCHPVVSDNLAESEGTGDAWADCSECGHLLFVLTDPTSEPPNYCPNCGRRIVEVD